jgi:hypothetical protein
MLHSHLLRSIEKNAQQDSLKATLICITHSSSPLNLQLRAFEHNSAPLNRHALFQYAKEASRPDDSSDPKAAS